MRYTSGETVQVGDQVSVDGDTAVVQIVVEPGTDAAMDWALPSGGLLVESVRLGLFSIELMQGVLLVRGR